MHKKIIITAFILFISAQNALCTEELSERSYDDQAIRSAALLDPRLVKLFPNAGLLNAVMLVQHERPEGYSLYFSLERAIKDKNLVALDATYNEYWQDTFTNLIEVLQNFVADTKVSEAKVVIFTNTGSPNPVFEKASKIFGFEVKFINVGATK